MKKKTPNYYLSLVPKCNLNQSEKDILQSIIEDYDVDENSSYPEDRSSFIVNYFDDNGNMVLALDVDEDTGVIDVLECEL